MDDRNFHGIELLPETQLIQQLHSCCRTLPIQAVVKEMVDNGFQSAALQRKIGQRASLRR